MRNKTVAIILVLLLSLTLFCGLTACNNEEESEVAIISILDGSFSATYNVGATLDLTNAKLVVTYVNGKVKTVSVTEAMVSGFDTATIGEKQMRIIYRTAIATFSYTVVAASEVKTPVRVTAALVTEDGKNYVSVSVSGVKAEENGVFAISFEFAYLGFTAGNIAYSQAESFAYAVKKETGVIDFVFYSSDGYTAYPADGALFRMPITQIGSGASVTVQNVRISNGKEDKSVPKFELKLN